MNPEDNFESQSISRLATKKQSLDDMYSAPANFLEIDVINPQTTIIAGKKKYTDYEIRMRVSSTKLITDEKRRSRVQREISSLSLSTILMNYISVNHQSFIVTDITLQRK